MTETYTFTNSLGDNIDIGRIDGEQYPYGLGGRSMPPITHLTQRVPGQDGSRRRSTRADERHIVLPFVLLAADRNAIRVRLAELATGLNPLLGDGTLTVTRSDATQREITCIYEQGLDHADDGRPTLQRFPLVFVAHEPYWRDAVPIEAAYTSGSVSSYWFASEDWFPFTFANSQVFSTATVLNNGDAQAWPVWTIRGPGAELMLTNNTTGKTLSLDYTIPTGSEVVIDTRPAPSTDSPKSVTLDGSTSLFAETLGSLWPLLATDNDIAVELTGTDSNSSVELSFQRRWLAI